MLRNFRASASLWISVSTIRERWMHVGNESGLFCIEQFQARRIVI